VGKKDVDWVFMAQVVVEIERTSVVVVLLALARRANMPN
jgi:hypothetical protein